MSTDTLADAAYGDVWDILNSPLITQELDADDTATYTFDDDGREELARQFTALIVKYTKENN